MQPQLSLATLGVLCLQCISGRLDRSWCGAEQGSFLWVVYLRSLNQSRVFVDWIRGWTLLTSLFSCPLLSCVYIGRLMVVVIPLTRKMVISRNTCDWGRYTYIVICIYDIVLFNCVYFTMYCTWAMSNVKLLIRGTQRFIDICGYPLPFMAVYHVRSNSSKGMQGGEPGQHWIPISLRVARCLWTYHLWGPVSAVASKAIDSMGIDPNLSRMAMEPAEKYQQLCIFGTFSRDVWWMLVSPPHWTGVLPANGNLGRS